MKLPPISFPFLGIFIFFSAYTAFSAEAAELFTIKTPKGTDKMNIIEIEEVKFSSDCDNKTCQAWKAYKGKEKPNLKAARNRGNPASRYCDQLKGKGLILRDAKGRQYDFCQFKDQSMVDSWGLYEKAL